MTTAIITVDELKSVVGKQTSDSDWWFEGQVVSATEQLEQYLGQNIIEASIVREFQGDDTDWMKLPGSWLQSITLLESRPLSSMDSADYKPVAATSYQLSPYGNSGQKKIIRANFIFDSLMLYRATFVNGLKIPLFSLRDAALAIGGLAFYNFNPGDGERQLIWSSLSRTFGQGGAGTQSIKTPDDLRSYWQSIVQPYNIITA